MYQIRTHANQALPLIRAEDFRARSGVNEGEALSFADELILDDVYSLRRSHRRDTMMVGLGPRLQNLRVQPGSAMGKSGNAVHLDCCVTLMDDRSKTVEALVLVEVEDGLVADIYILPFSELAAEDAYRLVGVDRHAATRRFAEVACVSFAKGTRITMATGEQRPIETLSEGDLILTRDAGPKPLRWIGNATMRAEGDFAPVRITAGTLSNRYDLLVSPDHRILIYQREDRLGTGQAEALVKVRHLINDMTVTQEVGGFIEYYQLLFDDHQIIYAEGVASESLLIDPRTRDAIPSDVADRVLTEGDAQRSRALQEYEVASSLLSKPDAVALLKAASTG